MFSITTMASSTTNPVAMVSAISERLSRLKPSRYMTAKVPISETGHSDAGNQRGAHAAQEDENHQDTRKMEMISVRSTSIPRRESWWSGRAPPWYRFRGKHGLKERQLRLDAVHGLDDVRARLAENDKHDGPLAIHITRGAEF